MDDNFKIDNRNDFEIIGFAYDGCEAVDMITTMGPDIVILDMKMPRNERLGGHPAHQRHGAGKKGRGSSSFRPSTILISSNRVMELGAHAYIKKPFQMRRLFDELQAARRTLRQ